MQKMWKIRMRIAPGFFVNFTEFDSVKLEKMTVLQREICFFGKHIDKQPLFRYNKTVACPMKKWVILLSY